MHIAPTTGWSNMHNDRKKSSTPFAEKLQL
ncbi:hypothetical protein SAMN02744775_04424, partial [Enterobacter sp. CC120223-11]